MIWASWSLKLPLTWPFVEHRIQVNNKRGIIVYVNCSLIVYKWIFLNQANNKENTRDAHSGPFVTGIRNQESGIIYSGKFTIHAIYKRIHTGNHRLVNGFIHKGSGMREAFPCHDVIMLYPMGILTGFKCFYSQQHAWINDISSICFRDGWVPVPHETLVCRGFTAVHWDWSWFYFWLRGQ